MNDVVHSVVGPVKAYLTEVYKVFGDDEVAIFASIVLLVMAFVLYAWFRIVRIAPLFRALARITKKVTSTDSKELFCAEFVSMDESFKAEPRLAHAWTKFEETLVKPERNEPHVIRSTTRPSFYLNVHAAVESGLPLPFYQSAPNYFVGIGLLFTFFGLVAALYFASQGVAENASVQDAQAALRKLLNVASFKFLTSISGILSSLFLSFAIKRNIHQLQVAFESLCKALEVRLDLVTLESIALMHLREQKMQTQQLQRFNTDFAIQLAEAIEKRITSSLASALSTSLQPLTKRLEDMSTSIGSANQDALERLLVDFTGSLQQSAGKEIELLATELRRIQETLQQTNAGVNQSGAQFGQRLENAATKLEHMLSESASSTRDGLSEAISRMQTVLMEAAEAMKSNALKAAAGTGVAIERAGGALAGHVASAAGQLESSLAPAVKALGGLEQLLHQLSGRMQEQNAEFNSSINGMRELVRQVDVATATLKDAALPVATTAEQLGRAATQTESASKVIGDAYQRIAALVTNLDEAVASNVKAWEEYRSRFENVDVSLANTVNGMLAGTERFHEEVTKFVTEIDKHLGSSLNSLAGGIEQLNDVAESLDETLGKALTAMGKS